MGETWVIVEGAKDAGALHGLGYLAVGLPTNRLNAKFVSLFREVDAIIMPDGDSGGLARDQKTAANLRGVARSVRIAMLPVETRESGGDDVRDVLRDQGDEAIRKAIAGAEPVAVGSADSDGPRQTILVDTDEERVISEAVTALSTRPDVFQRAGVLVHITRESEPPRGIARPKGRTRIAVLPRAILRERLASVAGWAREIEERVEAIHPPMWAVEAVEARGQWPGIPRLEAVVEVPILRADGSVLQSKGYDNETGILWEPQAEFPQLPARPTKQDAERARNELLEVVCDFPLCDDYHRAAWLAAVLTPAARFAFHGPAPLFLIDANVRGAGKTRLADCIGLIAAGREMARMTAPTNNEEARKAITALALAGEPLILFDNISGVFGCGVLDAALTGTTWSDRLLGSSKIVADVPLSAVWFATANNASLAADTARRCLWIRLESPEETPEERSGFRHPDLLGWIRHERPRLAVAALTILRAYHVAGRPDMGLKPWGSFEAWSDLVRAAVVWAGMPDPGATRRELTTQADREAVALRLLLDGWQEVNPSGRGITVADALKALGEYPNDYAALRSALSELTSGDPAKGFNTRSIGMKLHHLRRRVIGGRFLDSKPSPRRASGWLAVAMGLTAVKALCQPLTGARAQEKAQEAENSPISLVSPLEETAEQDF